MLYTFLKHLTIVIIIVVIYFMSKEISRRAFKPLNEGIARHVEELRRKLNCLRFDTIISSIDQVDEMSYLRHEARVSLIEKARVVMMLAIGFDIQQYGDIENYNGDKSLYPFDNYVATTLPFEHMAQEGLDFRPTASFRLVERITENTNANSRNMDIHFIAPDGMVLDDNVNELEVAEWLRDCNEIYIKSSSIGEDHNFVTVMYRISSEGVQEYIPFGDTDLELEIELQFLMDKLMNSHLDFMEAELVIDFYENIGKMELYPFEK